MTDHHIQGAANGREALRAVARWAGNPVWNRLRPRIETIAAERSDALARELRAEIAGLRAELTESVANLRAALDATNVDLGGQIGSAESRIGSQAAALDERVAVLERPPALAGDSAEQAAARSLVDEIRTEHARVRARLSAVASYEHRIATLEQTLKSLAGNGGGQN
ncbi:MAG TPA: hypothetical protein VH333_15115 [Pseudonocardiaceae bacterium]|jgi:chromosome segregation ATPase|nr:hypothetical protein [Pseudonocardiaceae bacterium]